MIGRTAARKRSIARTLQIALLGVTVVLAAIGAIGIAALYDARQSYEDALSETSALEVAAANLLTATVALEANLAQQRSRATAQFVARSAASVDRGAARVQALAAADDPSRAAAAPLAAARRDARALAVHPTIAATRASAATTLPAVRRAVVALGGRQEARRGAAQETARGRSRAAFAAIVAGAGLALLAVLALVALLIRAMRRPLDDLVEATRRMAAGDLAVRVDADGPRELETLGRSFNTMGADLATATARTESERQRLRTTIQSLGDGLVICDDADRVTSCNPRASELVALLQPGADAHGPGSPLPELESALAGEVTVVHEATALAVTAARLAGPDGGVVWTLRDVTERARLEQAKSDFVATASHELRSPLTSIKGFIELLETSNADNLSDQQREFIEIALQSTDRLVDLVNDLLDVARIEAGQFEIDARSCDLRAPIEEVAALMGPRIADKRQQLRVDVAEPRPPALADPARVRQIVTNLVTNAHLYTPEGGTISVRLRADARATTITVADTGRGMAPEDARRIFDRFYRGAGDGRKSPGTGLGLAIVKSLVDLHGGAIAVDSALGRGTTFEISLPGALTAVSGAATAAPALTARRVLVVDDEPSVAALIARQLETLGVQTAQVHTGAQALERLRAERFDAMTLDVLMPGMNGFDVLRVVRAEPALRDIPVVFVSVSSRLATLEGEWTVSKPIDRSRLVDVLQAAIEAKRTRVLVVAPAAVRERLEASLAGLGIEHRWCATTDDAARAGAQERFELALVHASMSGATSELVDGSTLRGRRRGRSVILFSTDADARSGNGGGAVGMPVFPLPQAVTVLRAALGVGARAGG